MIDGRASARRPLPAEPWSWNRLLPDARDLSIPEALARVAAAVPGHPAIVSEGRTHTYDELGATTRMIAHALLARGEPGAPVSIVAGHGASPVVALFGGLAAGMVCAHLDARDPVARVAALHERLGARLVLTDRAHLDVARTLADARSIVVVDDLELRDESDPGIRPGVEDPALVVFTSGSTGTPKGVLLGHGPLVQAAHVFGSVLELTPEDRVGVAGTYSFAATVNRVFVFALHGATGVTFDYATTPLHALPGWVDATGVTVLSFVPSVLRELCADREGSRMPGVRYVLSGGDTLYGRDVVAVHRRFAAASLVNRYSATEALGLSLRVYGPDDPVPDGSLPLEFYPWIELRLEDEAGVLVVPGEAGRVVVIGNRTAISYWRDPEATAERFFVTADGRRGVRLDDVARVRPDGLVEHVGRWDDRVKVHGVLVHPAEVERALVALPGIAEGAVLADSSAEGDTRLVAYAVPEAGVEVRGWEIRRDLANELPIRMAPTVVVMLDKLPRGPRGKLDRDQLPPVLPSAAVQPPGTAAGQPEPASATRPVPYRIRDLARLFGEVLGIDEYGLDDDFFDRGGDSLAAVELEHAVDEYFGVDLELSALLAAPTPRLLAGRLVRRRRRNASPLFELRTGGLGAPFVCVAGGGGHALAFRTLAGALDDRPVLAFQARGLEEAARPDYTVEAIARRNLRALGAQARSGPLVLAGFSFGGLVAYEMSRRLAARGAAPLLLVLLDAAAPKAPLGLVESAAPRPNVWSAGSPRGLPRRVSRRTRRRVRTGVELWTTGWVHSGTAHQYPRFRRLSGVIGGRYRPTGTYHGPTLLLQATEEPEPRDARWDLPHLGWSAFLDGPFDTGYVATTHGGLIRPPAVTVTADLVVKAIRDAGG